MAKRTFKPGDKVRDTFGRNHTVQTVQGIRVWVRCNAWIHPSNLTLVQAVEIRDAKRRLSTALRACDAAYRGK